jgi:hypothetical protein
MKTQALESHLYKNRKDATDDFKNQRGVGNLSFKMIISKSFS